MRKNVSVSAPDDAVELAEIRRRARQLAASGAARAIRTRAGLSLRELAERVGLHGQTLWQWENGHHRPWHAAGVRAWVEALDRLDASFPENGDQAGELDATGTDRAGGGGRAP